MERALDERQKAQRREAIISTVGDFELVLTASGAPGKRGAAQVGGKLKLEATGRKGGTGEAGLEGTGTMGG